MQAKASNYAKAKPQLARFYEQAHLELLGYKTFIIPKLYDKFFRFEKRLYGLGINPREYAEAVVVLLEGWARAKRMAYIPVPTFLSNFALSTYSRVTERQYVRVIGKTEEQEAIALYGELMLARYYINSTITGQPVSLKEAYHELEAVLPVDWTEAAKAHKRPTDQALAILSMEYNVCNPTSYKDIARSVHANL